MAYAFLYDIYNKIPYPDFIDALSVLVFLPPLFISEFTGEKWLMKSMFAPSVAGIVVSVILWILLDAVIAYVITFLINKYNS